MDGDISAILADWTAYYALMGGVAATLLGLQFVAVSLRLNIFRQQDVADVRDFAHFVFGAFLVAIVIAGLALAPHESRHPLALALLVVGLAGLLGIAWVGRVWRTLNRPPSADPKSNADIPRLGWALVLFAAGDYLILIVAAILLWRQHPEALGLLAIAEAWLLVMGTISAWMLLSHAGSETDNG